MNEENLLHWIALTRVEGIGTRLAHRLIEKFGTPEAVFQASLTELERCGLRAPSAQDTSDGWQDVMEELPAEIRHQLAPPAAENEVATSEPRSASLFDASFTADQKAVFGILKNDEPLFIDSIYGDLDLAHPRILTALLELEMSGMIRQLPGKNFLRRL